MKPVIHQAGVSPKTESTSKSEESSKSEAAPKTVTAHKSAEAPRSAEVHHTPEVHHADVHRVAEPSKPAEPTLAEAAPHIDDLPDTLEAPEAEQPVTLTSSTSGGFQGRLDRSGFALGAMIPTFILTGLILISALLIFLNVNKLPVEGSFISTMSITMMVLNITILLLWVIFVVVAIPVTVSIHIRRWHDLGKSGAMTFFSLIPPFSVFGLLFLLFAPGNHGDNPYGSSTTAARKSQAQ